jgi:hypothetical protein
MDQPSTLCPWSGLPCDCTHFPWLENEVVPEKCEALIRTIQALVPLRKIRKSNARSSR